MNGVKGYAEIHMDRMYDLETVSDKVLKNEEVLYA